MLQKVLVLVVLAAWILSGPIAMAFNGCAMMGAMCEAPCGMLSYIVAPFPSGLIALQPVMDLAERSNEHLAAAAPNPLDPPPKSSLLSA